MPLADPGTVPSCGKRLLKASAKRGLRRADVAGLLLWSPSAVHTWSEAGRASEMCSPTRDLFAGGQGRRGNAQQIIPVHAAKNRIEGEASLDYVLLHL
jgi:hypothetical protein